MLSQLFQHVISVLILSFIALSVSLPLLFYLWCTHLLVLSLRKMLFIAKLDLYLSPSLLLMALLLSSRRACWAHSCNETSFRFTGFTIFSLSLWSSLLPLCTSFLCIFFVFFSYLEIIRLHLLHLSKGTRLPDCLGSPFSLCPSFPLSITTFSFDWSGVRGSSEKEKRKPIMAWHVLSGKPWHFFPSVPCSLRNKRS